VRIDLKINDNFNTFFSMITKSGAMQVYNVKIVFKPALGIIAKPIPQFKTFPHTILLAAIATSTVLSTIQGLLPPNSKITGVRWEAAAAITIFPTCVDPAGRLVLKTYYKKSNQT
jgi:hypothetical protein